MEDEYHLNVKIPGWLKEQIIAQARPGEGISSTVRRLLLSAIINKDVPHE